MSIHNSGYIICSPFVHGAHGHAMAERWVTEQWCHGHSAWSMAFQALALVQSQLLGDNSRRCRLSLVSLMLEMACDLFWGWWFSLELLMLIIDLHPNIHWLLYSIQSIQLYRFVFSNPIHPFPSPNLSFKYCARIPFLPGDDLTIFTVTLCRSAPCAIDLHRSRDFCRANLRCLEWSVVRILFSTSAACEGGLLGLEVVVDVQRWEAMKVSLELNALTW